MAMTAALAWAGCGPALAATADDWVPRRDFHSMVEAAWQALPQRQTYAAQHAQAAARFRAGGSLTPDAPFLTGTYVNDKIAGSNQNYITTQLEAATPVWLPGEGTATQRAAHAESAVADADAEAAHLALAADLLDLAARVLTAEGERDVAQRRLATAQALSADLQNRLRVGEASDSDALAAQAEAAMPGSMSTAPPPRLPPTAQPLRH